MWKYFAIAYLLVAVASSAAMAATLEWKNGTAVVISRTAVCKTNGVDVGDTFNARYRRETSPKQDRLALISRRTAHIFGKNNYFQKKFQAADFAGYIGGGLVTNNSSTNPYLPSIRRTGLNPATFNADTPQIYLVFQIRDFFVGSGINGCDITVEATVLQ
jgi:hypothetical protein